MLDIGDRGCAVFQLEIEVYIAGARDETAFHGGAKTGQADKPGLGVFPEDLRHGQGEVTGFWDRAGDIAMDWLIHRIHACESGNLCIFCSDPSAHTLSS